VWAIGVHPPGLGEEGGRGEGREEEEEEERVQGEVGRHHALPRKCDEIIIMVQRHAVSSRDIL
jgi:hypothetical protein